VAAVSTRVWLHLVLGQMLMQVGLALIAGCSLVLGFVLPHGPEDPPLWLATFILVLGCFPVLAVAMLRARRSLFMLRQGRQVSARFKKKQVSGGRYQYLFEYGDEGRATIVEDAPRAELEAATEIVVDPNDERPAMTVDDVRALAAAPRFVAHLLVIPVLAIAGLIVLLVV
jgi:hypothetical protein